MDKIHTAINNVESGAAKKIEGNDFIVYKVGEIIRVDIKKQKE